MTDTDKMLNVREVGKILGISKMTIYRLIKEGKFPAYKIGNSIKILESELDRYLKECQVRGE